MGPEDAYAIHSDLCKMHSHVHTLIMATRKDTERWHRLMRINAAIALASDLVSDYIDHNMARPEHK